MAKRGDSGRRCVYPEQGPGRIAGDQPQEQERDYDHAEQDGYREKDPAHDIAQSGTGEEPGRERRCPPGRAASGREAAREGGDRLLVAELGSAAQLSQTSSNRYASLVFTGVRARSVAKRSGGLAPGRARPAGARRKHATFTGRVNPRAG